VGKEVANKEVANNEWRITAAVVRDTFTLLSRVRGLQATSIALGLVGQMSNVYVCGLSMPMLWCVVMCGGVWAVVSTTAVCILQCV